VRWVRYTSPHHYGCAVGVLRGDEIFGLRDADDLVPLLGELPEAERAALTRPAEVLPLSEATLLSPVGRPPSIRDFYAFEQHVRTARQRRGLEMDPLWYRMPVFYFSNPSMCLGPYDDIAVPAASEALDFELEVAAVIGRGGSDLTVRQGWDSIAGLMVFNDWSARDLQREEMRLNLGPAKGKDFGNSFGPFFVPVADLAAARTERGWGLTMSATVNGRPYSTGRLDEMYWSFGEAVAYASRDSRVMRGDLIGSGTCGTGCILELALVHGDEAYPWLRPGDTVELSVELLGTQHSTVTTPPAPPRAIRPERPVDAVTTTHASPGHAEFAAAPPEGTG
jgi:2-keto-4-pentenoate hydratase/2-oxohepta-3-ene-1,7-dioic acid hydratase in catechol pathway